MPRDEKIFVDVNIFMDILQTRSNWQSSLRVVNAVRTKKIAGYVSALTAAILYFLRRQELSESETRRDVKDSIKGFRILDLSSRYISVALDDKRFGDFEDALQFYSARETAKIIITRNKKDFAGVAKEVEVLTPEEFIRKYKI